MLRNEWLRRARFKKIKPDAEVAIFTLEVDALCTDWFKKYFDGRYPLEEKLSIAFDDTRPVYGYDIWHKGKHVYSHMFKYPMYVKPGEVLNLSLSDLDIEES